MPMGESKLPGIAAADIGKCALGVFKAGQKYMGKTLGICGEQLSIAKTAEAFSKVLGKEVVYNEVTPEIYRGFGFPGADDMGNMYQFKRDFEKEYCASRDVNLSRKLNPSLLSFNQWLEQNKNLIPME